MRGVIFRNMIEMGEDGCVPKVFGIGDVVCVEYRVTGLSTACCVGKIVEIGVEDLTIDCSTEYHSDIKKILVNMLDSINKFGGK